MMKILQLKNSTCRPIDIPISNLAGFASGGFASGIVLCKTPGGIYSLCCDGKNPCGIMDNVLPSYCQARMWPIFPSGNWPGLVAETDKHYIEEKAGDLLVCSMGLLTNVIRFDYQVIIGRIIIHPGVGQELRFESIPPFLPSPDLLASNVGKTTLPTAAVDIKCECGGDKANTTHSKWCPVSGRLT